MRERAEVVHTKEKGNAEIVGAYGIRPSHHRTRPANIPPQYRRKRCKALARASQFRAYAIRPYGGGVRNNAAAIMDERNKAIHNGGVVRNNAATIMDERGKAIPNGGEVHNYAAAIMDVRSKAAHHGGAIRNHAALAEALPNGGESGAIRAYAIRPYKR